MDWSPPENPDAKAILDEAQRDTAAGQYAIALQKHIWFHHNALKLQPSLYGVRLSFALVYWKTLADQYPPALQALIEIRDTAEKTVRSDAATGDELRNAFHEFEAINKFLNETSRTCNLFAWLDTHKPSAARQFYRLAQTALLRAKEYALCGKFLDPKNSYAWSLKRYQEKKNLPSDPKLGINMREFGEKCFANEIAILIALMVLNGQDKEAERIGVDALNEFEDADFEETLEHSIKGIVPEPWP